MAIKYWEISSPDLASHSDKSSPLLELVAEGRGVDLQNSTNEYHLSDHPMIKDMDKAVTRIRQAIENEEAVAIYGDYDCDGITSTALLYSYLENEGLDVSYYIPDRHSEGYGLNKKAILSLYESGITLIITVDNGISAIEEVDYASSLGIDVVITDHHKPRDILPMAVAVVDPHRKDCPSGLTHICGVGVVFALITALEDGDEELVLDQYGDIIAIGTIADVVDLIGVNKTIVNKGIQLIQNHSRIGLISLLDRCKISPESVTAETLAFGIVPRINSAGRIGDVETSLLLLMTQDHEQAEHLAGELDRYNTGRRSLETEIVSDIATTITNNPHILNNRVIVICGKDWHHGVIGIVAAKVCEKYGKPTILLSEENGEARGSGRSVEGFSLIEGIFACGELLERYGGHPMAAGLTLKSHMVEEFTTAINQYAKEKHQTMPVAKLKIDGYIRPNHLTVENVRDLDQLAPYGAGNPSPVFAIKDSQIEEIVPLAGGKHIRLKLNYGGMVYQALLFSVSPDKFPYKIGEKVDIAFSVDINVFNNRESVSVKITDIRKSGLDQDHICGNSQLYHRCKLGENLGSQIDTLIPSREDGAKIYRKIKELGSYNHGRDNLYINGGIDMGYCRYMLTLDVLEELGLIDTTGSIALKTVTEKRDFNSSEIIKSLQEANKA